MFLEQTYKSIVLIIAVMVTSPIPAKGQETCSASIVAMSPGGASTAYVKGWSPNQNPAMLSATAEDNEQRFEVGIAYNNRFCLKELSTVGVMASVKSKYADFGMAYSRFGTEHYNENIATLSVGRRFNKYLIAGIGIDCYFVSATGIGTRATAIAEVGYACELTNDLTLGAFVFNPLMTDIYNESGKVELPSVYSLGAGYDVTKYVSLNMEGEYEVGERYWNIRGGMEWNAHEWVQLQLGFQANPLCPEAGLAFKYDGIKISSRFSYNSVLGLSSACVLSYGW